MFGIRGIKKQLLKRKAVLENKMKSDMETSKEFSVSDISSGELSSYDNHPAESATQLYEREKDLAFNKMNKNELKNIQDALDKIENGTYGIDEKTGKKIPRARLKAYPAARTAVQHTTPEHNHKVRPAEESVIADLDQSGLAAFRDGGFDEQNAFDLVSLYNDQRMVFENAPYSGQEDGMGFVDDLEGFAATDIDGYHGDDDIQILRNQNYERWRNNYDVDETDPMER
ncbi:hypothetical protein [Sporolactobacillus sp. THM19-2]|uniref:hypothetical protein n=1 Tax=Sporolactobacillus sp. THM19-2 TaxID=2511171 RepID=UPI00101F5638|nr:hypothetical protein [Sporolactobacillus sp. THM19-2]RYL92888.1 hypothetical protein EWH91_06225 [Sporolactobacillus sp. THM19-2]